MPRTRTIADLQREIESKQQYVDELMRKRQQLAAELDAVDRQIAIIRGKGRRGGRRAGARAAGGLRTMRRGAKRAGAKRSARDPGHGKSLKTFLADALAKAGKPMRALDLSEAVTKAGYATRDRNFRQTVASALAGDKRFQRLSRGIYRLAATK